MKYLILALFSISLMAASAQADFDERLLAKFSEERIAQLQEEHPGIIDYWTFYLDNSYHIVDTKTSGKSLSAEQTLKIRNLNDFNILKLGVTMDRNRSSYYKIAGTDSYLLLLSNREFVNSFNHHNNLGGAKQ